MLRYCCPSGEGMKVALCHENGTFKYALRYLRISLQQLLIIITASGNKIKIYPG